MPLLVVKYYWFGGLCHGKIGPSHNPGSSLPALIYEEEVNVIKKK